MRAGTTGDQGLLPGAPDMATARFAAAEPAIVCFPFAGGLVGGSHMSALGLVAQLDRRRFAPLVLLHRAEGPLLDLLRARGIAFEVAPCEAPAAHRPGVAALGGTLAAAAPLARFLKRRGARIVHTNEGAMHATWALPARLAGARLLWHHRGNPGARGLRLLAPWLADRVVSVSRYAAPAPGLISAAAKCTVIYSPFDTAPTGLDRAAARTAALAALDLPATTHLLGYFGHFTARKRPLVFIESIAALRRARPDLPIAGLMFGDVLDPGLDVAAQALAAERGVADIVRFMGFRTPPDQWLAACDLHVVTAVAEPFGRTIIESMLLGTPVVAAASGGNCEAIRHGETGWLAPADDPEAFAAIIARLLAQPAMRAVVADAAATDAVAKFGLARHAESVSAIYRELLAA